MNTQRQSAREKAWANNRARKAIRLDDFAERLANGEHPAVAAQQMGFVEGYGWKMLSEIRARLGSQAV
jgi:hypothetical protein